LVVGVVVWTIVVVVEEAEDVDAVGDAWLLVIRR